MRIGALIQARMTSARLPGKVLLELAGKPVLQRVVERVQAASGLDGVAVATSEDASDDPVAAWCRYAGVRCLRGSLQHVAGRLASASARLRLDAFVRVCADSPLICSELINEAVQRMREGGPAVDVVTNASPRSFPKGQSVEVIRTSVLRDALEKMHDAAEREHVTLHFYRRPARFCVQRLISPMEVTDVSMAVDEAADLLRLEALLASDPQAIEDAGWMELVQHLRRRTASRAIGAHAAPRLPDEACFAPA